MRFITLAGFCPVRKASIATSISAGLRPATPDNAPAIGPGAVPGLHWAVGHYRNGILLAPITAELVAAGLCAEALPELAAPFAPGRFASPLRNSASGVRGAGVTVGA